VKAAQFAVLAIGFLLGVSLMGVEMAAMRMLTPYFGSSIDIWACMISTVMLSLMAGYYLGGLVADRAPRTQVLGAVVLAAGIFLCAVPPLATPVLDAMSDQFGQGDHNTLTLGALLSAILMMFLPMTLLSFFSPFAVRLLLADTAHGGRVAGSVYSITTIGNIVGTLGTALGLMRFMGSRDIMFSFAALIIVCGLALIGLRTRAQVDAG
jgi:hypothetical protein